MPYTVFSTVIGDCGIAWNEAGVTAFRLPSVDGSLRPDDFPAADRIQAEPATWVQPIITQVQAHLSGQPADFSEVRFDFARASSFQQAVYRAALEVKSGMTQTYGWLAKAIGQPISASRAVGTALGQNPWPLLVPCHRFVSSDGKMTGFSAPGGIQTKLRLLSIEGAELFPQ